MLFLPSEIGNVVCFAKLTDLLPEFQAALNEARTPSGWDQHKLSQIVAHEYGFLGAFVTARVEEAMQDGGEKAEFLVVEFRPPQGRDLDKAERLFERATQRAGRGDVRSAVPDLKRLVAQFPEIPKYHQALGQAYLETDKLDAAEDELLQALRLDPQLEDALTLLANVYQKRGTPQTAVPLYRRSIELRRNVYALSNLGAVLAQTGDLSQAIATLEEAIQEDAAYPNAWYGLGFALYKTGDPALLPRAMDALDKALGVIGERKRAAEIWDSARQLLDHIIVRVAQAVASEAQRINEDVAQTEAERGGLPVRREEGPLGGGILAKLEYGWVHRRPYHRLLVQPSAGIEREHLVRHELEHLRLVNLARAAQNNRWFVTTSNTQETASKALQRDLEALSRKRLPVEQVQVFLRQVMEGMLTQLYNTPIDLLIESRILDAHPNLGALVYLSVKGQLELGLRAAEDTQIRQLSPRAIFRANVAMNGAFALWFEDRWPRRTDLLTLFQRTEAWSLAQRLYAHWKATVSNWAPGAEYEWIDTWAEMLGLKSWFAWKDGNNDQRSERSHSQEGGRPGSTRPMSEAEQMAFLHYLLGALEWLDREGLARARDVAAEIAALGMGGIDLHGIRKYTLRTIPGKEFSGRHLVSYLYVCLKALDPTIDPGIDLHEPYLQALELHRQQRKEGV